MDNQRIIVVSGIPRSGTSLMMKMLEAAGIAILSDGLRQADADNPKGYYEHERVKKLDEGDTGWLKDAGGKAVKIVSPLLKHLPAGFDYDVIFMRRELNEVLASQRKMLERNNKVTDGASDEKLAMLFKAQLEQTIAWARTQKNFRVVEIDFNALVSDPEKEIGELEPLFAEELDIKAIAKVVDPELYRQRMGK